MVILYYENRLNRTQESVPQLAIHQRLSQRSELSSKKSAQRTKEAKAESRARKLAQFQSIMLTARHLSGIVIRDSDAARTLFKLLLSMDCLSVFTHREFAKLVLLLAESNATSRQLLAECEEIPALFDLVIGRVIQDEQLDMSTAAHVTSGHRLLWQLLSTLYMFRINASDAARMFDVVANVANATVASSRKFPSHLSEIDITDRRGYPGDSDSMRSSVGSLGAATTSVDVVNNGVTNVVTTQILATINAIASHREPRFQFSLDGRGGCFMSGPLDSFPSARHGFTLSCWIKPVAFTCAETGFFSLDDRHKQLAGPACPATPPLQHNSFELFFREIRGFQRIPMFPRKSTATQSNLASGVAVDLDTPNGSARYCLAIRMHHSPSSPEDFVFDAYDFSKKAGAWSLITFSHHRSSLSLFVDGALVQTCSSFTYPKVSSYKEKALVAVVGRKKVNVKKAEPSRQSGADLPANVATTSSSWFGGFWGSTTAVTPSCDTTAAPTPAADTTPSVTTGSFFGSISPIDIIEGAIDPSTICRLYNAGPSNKYFLRQSGLEPLRVVHVLHPQQAKMPSIHEMVPLSAATGRLSSLSMLETESVRHFSRIQPLTASNASIATHFSSALVDVWPAECEEEHRTAVDLAEGCRVHAAVSFRDVFADIGGFPVVFKLVATMDQSIRLSGLRILASLLRQDQSRTAEFVETQGWNVLTALLSADPSAIDISIVDVLLEMACDSERRGHTRLLRRPYAFRLVADLVLLSDDAVQQHAIRQCTEMILKVPENYSVWREQFGIQYMFDVLCCGSRAVRGQIFTALDTLFDSMEVGDVGMLLDFVAHDKRQNQDVKFELMAILVRHCLYNENLVAHVNALGGISLLISFLHAPMERLRNSVLTLLGVLMSGNVRVNRPLMVKSALFDGLCLLMASFELSRDTCSILFGLALNWYVCDERNDVRHKKMFGADVARTASGGDVVSSGRLVDPLQCMSLWLGIVLLLSRPINSPF